jgi:membrane-associated phospholipid phosphatase
MGAAAGIVLLLVTWLAAFHVGIFRNVDRSVFQGFAGLHHHPPIHTLANFFARLCDPQPYVFFAAVPVIIALARRRPRLALAVGAIMLGANVTAELIKPLLAAARATDFAGVAPSASSWPSGHATAAMSLALAFVLASPARLRPFAAALGAAFAVAVSYSFLSLGWHYPSDVFGGFLIAATWTMLGIAALFATDARRPRANRPVQRLPIAEALGPPAAALVGAVVLAGIVAIARPHPVVSYARAHEAFMVGAVAIGMLALSLATAIMLAMRR